MVSAEYIICNARAIIRYLHGDSTLATYLTCSEKHRQFSRYIGEIMICYATLYSVPLHTKHEKTHVIFELNSSMTSMQL